MRKLAAMAALGVVIAGVANGVHAETWKAKLGLWPGQAANPCVQTSFPDTTCTFTLEGPAFFGLREIVPVFKGTAAAADRTVRMEFTARSGANTCPLEIDANVKAGHLVPIDPEPFCRWKFETLI
ncbi:MAG: hypothetical protein K9G48_08315 [Reyranella sp.]|nr:hypothetical protein [Reyranella sp.]